MKAYQFIRLKFTEYSTLIHAHDECQRIPGRTRHKHASIGPGLSLEFQPNLMGVAAGFLDLRAPCTCGVGRLWEIITARVDARASIGANCGFHRQALEAPGGRQMVPMSTALFGVDGVLVLVVVHVPVAISGFMKLLAPTSTNDEAILQVRSAVLAVAESPTSRRRQTAPHDNGAKGN